NFAGMTGGKLTVQLPSGSSPASLDIAYAGKIVQVEATATLSIDSYVYINGTFDFQSGAVADVVLSDNSYTLAVTAGADYVLTDGTSTTTLLNGSTASQIQTALGAFTSIGGLANVSVTP